MHRIAPNHLKIQRDRARDEREISCLPIFPASANIRIAARVALGRPGQMSARQARSLKTLSLVPRSVTLHFSVYRRRSVRRDLLRSLHLDMLDLDR